MEANNNTVQLLENLEAQYGEGLNLNQAEVARELDEDAFAYKGLGIKLLSIVGGLLGSAFFLGFVGLTLSNSEWAILFIGLAFMGGAVYLNKQSKSTILDTVSIATYLAGFAMVAMGVEKVNHSANFDALVLMVLTLLTTVLTTGFMLNFFSVLLINGCLFALIDINNAYQLMHAYTAVLALAYVYMGCFEPELIARNPKVNQRYMAWFNGLLFSFIVLIGYLGISVLHRYTFTNTYVSSIIIITIAFLLLHRIIIKLALPAAGSKITIYVMGALLLSSTVFAPAISGALLIILLSYQVGHRTGLIMGIIVLVYFTGQYYYDLQYTLLVKSEIMMASGALFLMAWFILNKQLKRYEQN